MVTQVEKQLNKTKFFNNLQVLLKKMYIFFLTQYENVTFSFPIGKNAIFLRSIKHPS